MPILVTKPRRHAKQGASPILVAIARRAREARVAAGLSQAELALTCGVARTTIIAIENARPGVAIEKVQRVLSGLGLTLTVAQAG
ncbi:MAG TPA: helix-turn-helix domain-containing protein [Burkholderiales bacterium]|jgi:DNA-binding XRE family transcriptional regulator|nr:helix-turn-helix domain-containing protein [Burkholderiales bacterium]